MKKAAKTLYVAPVKLLNAKKQKSIQILLFLVTEDPLPKRMVATKAAVLLMKAGMVVEPPLKMVEAGVWDPLLLNPPLLGAVHLTQLLD